MSFVVHLEADLLVVNKPAGLLSVPGRGEDKQDCAWSRAGVLCPDAQVVHRLDMATSGLLLLARGAVMQRALSMAFAERQVHKRYEAVVCGEPAADEGQVDLPLRCDWPNRPRQMVDPVQGKPSTTRWRVLARGSGRTRLALEPVTGRSHQLRVHMAAMGWPIAGDELYGDVGAAPRLLLHASELALAHPLDSRPLAWTSRPPF